MTNVPKRYYRYGIASEKTLFDEVEIEIDGFVLPAHLVVDQKNSLSSWLSGKSFFIDPMTHVWFLGGCDLSKKKGKGLKRSYEKIKKEYGPLFKKINDPKKKINCAECLDPTNQAHADLIESIQAVIDYQLNFVNDANWNKKMEIYNKILEENGMNSKSLKSIEKNNEMLPDRLVLPYIFFGKLDSPEYRLNKLIWDVSSQKIKTAVPIFALIATDSIDLDWKIIINDLKGKVKGIILWLSCIDELYSSPDQLKDLRKICKLVSSSGFRVCIHAGGAFSMGLGDDGVESVAGGITYGDYRGPELTAGGAVPQRYFIPQLLRVFQLGETKLLLEKLGIDCNNPCCKGIKDVESILEKFFPPGDNAEPDEEIDTWGPTRGTKLHYLYRFKQSTDEVWGSGRKKGVEILRKKEEYVIDKILPKYYQHLDNWIKAYEEKPDSTSSNPIKEK